MSKIKVLHIIKTLGLGGAEVNLFNLIHATDKNRFEIHVAYSAGGEIEEKFRTAGINLFKFSEDAHKLKSIASLLIVLRLAGYIWKNNIQIIHTHSFNTQVWGGIAARLTGCKVVEHVHDFRYLESEDFERRRGTSNQYKFVKYFKHLADIVIVLTKQNRGFLLEHKIQPAEKIREFQNGIPMPNKSGRHEGIRAEIVKKFNIPTDALIILTPIRLAPEKNADLILHVAPQVIKEVPNAFFLIAGDGPLFEIASQEIKQYNLDTNIKMIGFQSDISNLLKASDIMLLPSFLELHSIAILEAMSMKVPVVVSQDVGCNSEFIKDGENGMLRDPFQYAGWDEALIRLLKDENLRRNMGQEGYLTCQKEFDIKNVVKNFESVYEQLASH